MTELIELIGRKDRSGAFVEWLRLVYERGWAHGSELQNLLNDRIERQVPGCPASSTDADYLTEDFLRAARGAKIISVGAVRLTPEQRFFNSIGDGAIAEKRWAKGEHREALEIANPAYCSYGICDYARAHQVLQRFARAA